MKNKRSSGHDYISSTILKLALPYVVESLTYVYNLCIQHSIFPNILKVAKVIPLPKTKDLNDPNKFRPISLLSTISKPIERHVHKHLHDYLESNNLFYPLQSGFRPGHSCETALLHLVNRWLISVNEGKITGAVFLDLSKAFDLVNHNLLLNKLAIYNCSKTALNFFSSYLNNRTQYVVVNGNKSNAGVLQHGVPQGSILGPLLFTIFINDLHLSLSDKSITLSSFADDSTIDASSKSVKEVSEKLQRGIIEISEWCQNNNMILNASKTKSMIITTRQKHQIAPLLLNLNLNSDYIEQVNSHRVLGIIIDQQLSWKQHIDKTCKALSKNLFLLSRIKPLADMQARKIFYHAHIQPYLDYGSSLWDGASESSLKRLNSLHRRAIKLIVDTKEAISTDEKFVKLQILSLKEQHNFNKLVIMRKITLGTAPNYLSSFVQNNGRPQRRLGNEFFLPRAFLDIFKTSFSYSGPILWNSIPYDIRLIHSLTSFKSRLHTYLLHPC